MMRSAGDINIDKVSKQFKLFHNAAFSLKRQFIGIFHKRHRQQVELFDALNQVTFSITRGESIALMGHNGSGKSTLMQIISHILKPSHGEVMTQGRVAPLIELGVGFHPELTGIDNIFLNASLYGVSNKKTREHLDAIIDFAELRQFIDTPVKNYSSGMYMRLGFSVAVHIEPDILLADEVLAVGDIAFKEKCCRRIQDMQAQGMTLIFVTHSIEQAKQFCSRYIKLENGKMIDAGKTASL